MKKFGLFIVGLCALFYVGNFTQAKDYEYTNLDITANILNDGTINVNEKFTANFFVNKHGIIRDIPLNYSVEGKDFHIEISNINVYRNKFTTNESDGWQHIKVGDEKWTVIGEQKYSISYSTYGLIKNFSGIGYAELYRNLVGYDFDTNINKVRAEIILPKIYTGFTKDDFLITTDGKSNDIDGFKGTVDRSQGDRIIITYDKVLPKKQGITLSVKFPNNFFEFDNKRQANLSGYIHSTTSRDKRLHDIILIFCISYVILSLLITFIRFDKNYNKKFLQTKGKLKGEFVAKYPVIIQYKSPEGLNSAEVGLLLHRGAVYMDVLSLIYKWINEGIVSINEHDGKTSKTTLIKIKNIPDSFSQYEKTTFYNIFKDNDLQKEISKETYINFDNAIEELNKYGEKKGWLFSTKLSILKKKFNNILLKILIYILEPLFRVILFLFMSAAFILSSEYLIPSESNLSIIIFFINAVLFCFASITIKDNIGIIYKKLYNRSYYKETEEGAKLIAHILGYREFLANCDENRLRLFLNDDPLYFDKVLPYAIVFGLETELIKKIKPIMEEMNIKSSQYAGDFISLSDSISTVSSIASHSGGLSSSHSSYSSDSGWDSGSSFSGGGSSFSSGGGGGGGGGRSW